MLRPGTKVGRWTAVRAIGSVSSAVGARLAGRCGDPEAGGGIALGVEIDQQDGLTARGEGGGEIDRGGRLANAALLIGNRDDTWLIRSV